MIEKLFKLLKIKFAGELALKDGTMIMVDGDLTVGASVSVMSPDGPMALPDGDYELETGEIISVKDGKIENITEVVDTEETPDVNGMPPVSEIVASVEVKLPEPTPTPEVKVEVKETVEIPVEPKTETEVELAIGDNLPPISDTGKTPDPEVEKLKGIVSELSKRLDDLESKVSVKAELETKMQSDLELIKQKTLVTELKKSKDVEDRQITRMDIIKNLKNNK